MLFGGIYNARGNEEVEICNDMEVLDLEKMKWIDSISLEGDCPSPRFSHTAEMINSDMYLFGGCGDLEKKVKFNDLWKVNLKGFSNMKWEQVNPGGIAPEPRHGHTMNVLHELLIVFGGENDKNELLNDVVIYHSESNEWVVPVIQGVVPRARYHHASTCFHNDSIVIFGGRTS